MKTVYWSRDAISMHRPSFCAYCGNRLYENICVSCGMKIRNTPDVGVAVVIFNENLDQVLLCQRNQGVFRGGLWCLPCGYMEYNESYIDAAIREVKEETGYTIRILRMIDVFDCYLLQRRHTVTIALLGEVVSGSMKAASDAQEVDWISLDHIPNLLIAFEADKEAIRIAKEIMQR